MAKKTATTPRSTTTTSITPKSRARPNASILTFFKKVEPVEQSLFVEGKNRSSLLDEVLSEPLEDPWADTTTPKRRKLSGDFNGARAGVPQLPNGGCTPPPPPELSSVLDSKDEAPKTMIRTSKPTAKDGKRHTGPFLEDSDSEEEVEVVKVDTAQAPEPPQIPVDNQVSNDFEPPISSGDFEEFEGLEDFEEFGQGEEFDERRWMEQQELLDMEQGAFEGDNGSLLERGLQAVSPSKVAISGVSEPEVASCPICNTSLRDMSDHQASVHVNSCLDGTGSVAIVDHSVHSAENVTITPQIPSRPPKPGQKDPTTLTSSSALNPSAFSRLMLKQNEDVAWASAAAAEVSSRGKPSYTRTCPFYKIMPGFSICVDAFRYGAVAGCQAYFLSHFHSDHYIGLTSSWSHGPIYCSRVTANLVRAQLRVDPKWVIGIEFEDKIEIPNTDGAKVTMIPANHCPGSSLFLFEKAMGQGKNPKMHRILHCGDFRACREHLEHPLLRPEVLDAVTGKTRQQKIDACYLDTTYLNPKYAFPEQEAVIKACSELCVKLNADAATGLGYDKVENGEGNLKKFLQPDEASTKTTTAAERHCDNGRLLVVVGTYSIGKERICVGIARAMKSKIYAPPGKQKICASLEDPELSALLTTDPREAQVHMTPLFEIRGETLDDYLCDYRDAFSRAVGFRPTGWNYRPPNSRFIESPAVQTVLYGQNWRSSYAMKDMTPQRGSTKRAACYGVPYSEHSSFRELTMFCCALRIDRIIPTVNVGSAKSREKMRTWVERWTAEKKKNGLFKVEHF